jgi:hypothetical protein
VYAIDPDNAVRTRVYLQVTQVAGGVQPPLAVIDIGDNDDNEDAFPLTPDQLRRDRANPQPSQAVQLWTLAG